jgi:signal transduction histidine kinase
LLALCGAAWLVLILACGFAVRESPSASARARAGFVCVAGLLLPAILVVPLTWGSDAAQIGAAYLWTSALVIPLPIGFAISRYNLFDVGWHARHGAARTVYFVAASLAVAALIYAGTGFLDSRPAGFGPILATTFGCLVLAEALRRPLLGFLEAALSPRSQDLRSLRERCSRELSSLSSEHEIGRLLLQILQEGVGCGSGWILLRHGSEWESAESIGGMEPPAPDVADLAAARVESQAVVSLDEEGSLMAESGISVVSTLEHGDEQLGLVLLGSHRLPLSGIDLDFIAAVTSYAAIAIHNSRLADERAAIERQATISRVAIDLMHDIGKDLGWMRGLASRLTARTKHDARLYRPASQVGDLAESLVLKMRDFVADATTPRDDPPGVARLDELMERSLRDLRERFGTDRIRLRHDSTIRGVRCHENVGRIVQNLVDNAIRDSSPADSIQVSATFNPDGWMLISVIDSGCGIPDDLMEQALEPGFTTRRSQGGMGVGLTISRDMTEALGGKLELSRASGGGVQAEVQIPVPESWRPS